MKENIIDRVQTVADRRNFACLVKRFMPEVTTHSQSP